MWITTIENLQRTLPSIESPILHRDSRQDKYFSAHASRTRKEKLSKTLLPSKTRKDLHKIDFTRCEVARPR